ncbi:uncharacterized protein LOC141824451 [Curcuma longa]|uniref:uncharacterized protein LOC141824451 n=1 Tax=Curcuma longa TaxID=136217 RepID=UPI003D9F7371
MLAHSSTTLPQAPPLYLTSPFPFQPPKSGTMHPRKSQLLPPHRRTSPLIWCAAIVCVYNKSMSVSDCKRKEAGSVLKQFIALFVAFQSLGLELYFRDRLIAVQALRPFAQRTGESRLEATHMITSKVLLPAELAAEIQQQVRENSVVFNVRGSFKVRARLGAGQFSYWIYTRCEVKLTSPPNGVLVARRCRKD